VSKPVVITGMIHPYQLPDRDSVEVWCVNRAYVQQMDHDNREPERVYFFDNPKFFPDEFLGDINKLETCRVISRKAWGEVPRCEVYPYGDVVSNFGGLEYFSCSVAYMLAHAIYEKRDPILLSGMYYRHDSTEYFLHKPCVEFWVGVACGLGAHVKFIGDTQILQPWPWSSKGYGYELNKNEVLAVQMMACTYRAALGMPVVMQDADEMSDKDMSEYKDVANFAVSGCEYGPKWTERSRDNMPKEEVLT